MLEQIKSDNEDIKLKLDAILTALILPNLGKTKMRAHTAVSKLANFTRRFCAISSLAFFLNNNSLEAMRAFFVKMM